MVLAAMAAVAFLLSWLTANHYPPWNTFHNESLAFLAMGLLVTALLLAKTRLELDPVLGLPALLIGVVCLQWASGLIVYRGDAVVSSLFLGGFALAWFAGGNAARESAWGERLLVWFAAVLVIAAVVSVYIAMLQWLGLEAGHANLVSEKDAFTRPGGNLAQANHLGTLLLMGIAMSVLLHVQRRIKLWQLVVLLTWLSLGVTMAESRAAWVSAIAMGVVFIWKGRRWIPGGIRAVLVWWGLLSLMWISWRPLNEALLLTAVRSAGDMVKDSGRVLMWRQMLAGIEQSPWWGYGWRQTVVGQKAGSEIVPGGAITDYAHSLVLDLCLWLGLPLALLLMLGAAWWLSRTLKRVTDTRQLLLMCCAVPVLVHSLVEFPFAYAYFLFTIAALLGMLSAMQRTGEGALKKTPCMVGRTVPAIIALTFAGVSAWAAWEYVEVEEDYRVMRFEMRNVGKRPDGHEVPDLMLLDQLGDMLQLGRLTPSPGMRAEDIERLRIASGATMWATAQMRYAIALGLNDNPQEASRQLTLLRNYYGETSFKQAKAMILELQKDEYPELAKVKLP